MILWGDPEQVHMQNMEQLHTHDQHQNMTEHGTTSGHRIWSKVYTCIHNSGTGVAHHMFCRTCTLRLHRQIPHPCHCFWHVLALIAAAIDGDEWLQRNCESGSSTNYSIDRGSLFCCAVVPVLAIERQVHEWVPSLLSPLRSRLLMVCVFNLLVYHFEWMHDMQLDVCPAVALGGSHPNNGWSMHFLRENCIR